MYHLLKGICVFLFFLFSNISCTQKVIALEKNIATTKSFLFKKRKKRKKKYLFTTYITLVNQ